MMFWRSDVNTDADMATQIMLGNCYFFYRNEMLVKVGGIVIWNLIVYDLISTVILFDHMITKVQMSVIRRRSTPGQLALLEHLAAIIHQHVSPRSQLYRNIRLTLILSRICIRMVIGIMVSYLVAALNLCLPHTPIFICLGMASTAIHGVIWSQMGISFIFTMFLIHQYISYKIHQVKLCKIRLARNTQMLTKSLEWKRATSNQVGQFQMELTCKILRDLTAFKRVLSSVQIADRYFWGKLFILHTSSSFVLFTNVTYQGLFMSHLPVLMKSCLYPSIFIVYAVCIAPLVAAGEFVKAIRQMIPHLVSLSFLWPQLPTQPKGQLMINELVTEMSNPNRGIGFRFAGLTPPITKLTVAKATLALGRGVLLTLKKYQHS